MKYVTAHVHVKELLKMLHQHVLLRYTQSTPPQKPTIPPSAPKHTYFLHATPQSPPPPMPQNIHETILHPLRKEALGLPWELGRTVATACPGDLRKGLQVAQLLSVPQNTWNEGRKGRESEGWWRYHAMIFLLLFKSFRAFLALDTSLYTDVLVNCSGHSSHVWWWSSRTTRRIFSLSEWNLGKLHDV